MQYSSGTDLLLDSEKNFVRLFRRIYASRDYFEYNGNSFIQPRKARKTRKISFSRLSRFFSLGCGSAAPGAFVRNAVQKWLKQ
jgi:hypothetical protein